MAKKRLSHEDFVVAWQSSASLGEVAKRAQVTVREASLRAFYLRQKGVPLKTFKKVGKQIDVEKLIRLVKKCT